MKHQRSQTQSSWSCKHTRVLRRVELMNMIELNRVGMVWSHFRAETSRYLAPYFEHFQAFPELQNLRRKTSRCWPEVSEGPKSISDFNFAHRSPESPISAQNVYSSCSPNSLRYPDFARNTPFFRLTRWKTLKIILKLTFRKPLFA